MSKRLCRWPCSGCSHKAFIQLKETHTRGLHWVAYVHRHYHPDKQIFVTFQWHLVCSCHYEYIALSEMPLNKVISDRLKHILNSQNTLTKTTPNIWDPSICLCLGKDIFWMEVWKESKKNFVKTNFGESKDTLLWRCNYSVTRALILHPLLKILWCNWASGTGPVSHLYW